MDILTRLSTLYIWAGAIFLLLLLHHIARFYQMTTGVRSYYRLFLVPMGLLILGTLRYLIANVLVAGDEAGDLVFFVGGLILLLQGYFLLKLMTGGR